MRRVIPLLLLPLAANAHELAVPKLDVVTISREGATIVVEHSIAAAKADELRAIYDRDEDGSLDAGERALLESYVSILATRPLSLELDGARVRLSHEIRLEAPPRGEIHATVTVRGTWRLSPGEHRIAIRDRHERGVPVVIGFANGLTPASGAALRANLTSSEPVLAVAFEAS